MNKHEVIVLAQGVITCSGYTGTVLPQLYSCLSTCMQKKPIILFTCSCIWGVYRSWVHHLCFSIFLILSFIFQHFFREHFWHLLFDSVLDTWRWKFSNSIPFWLFTELKISIYNCFRLDFLLRCCAIAGDVFIVLFGQNIY